MPQTPTRWIQYRPARKISHHRSQNPRVPSPGCGYCVCWAQTFEHKPTSALRVCFTSLRDCLTCCPLALSPTRPRSRSFHFLACPAETTSTTLAPLPRLHVLHFHHPYTFHDPQPKSHVPFHSHMIHTASSRSLLFVSSSSRLTRHHHPHSFNNTDPPTKGVSVLSTSTLGLPNIQYLFVFPYTLRTFRRDNGESYFAQPEASLPRS